MSPRKILALLFHFLADNKGLWLGPFCVIFLVFSAIVVAEDISVPVRSTPVFGYRVF